MKLLILMLKNEKKYIWLTWTSEVIQFSLFEMHMDKPQYDKADLNKSQKSRSKTPTASKAIS